MTSEAKPPHKLRADLGLCLRCAAPATDGRQHCQPCRAEQATAALARYRAQARSGTGTRPAYTCATCGGRGHNSRTCGELAPGTRVCDRCGREQDVEAYLVAATGTRALVGMCERCRRVR